MIKDCTKSYNTSEESGVKLNYFDNKIDQFATYLQKRNNLDHIQFLQVRLGMQVLAKNIGKLIVMYTLAYILDIFLYTLITNLSFYLIRRYAHGAHAPSSFWCYIESITLFIILPLLILHLHINGTIMIVLTIICLGLVIKYAPAATKKKPIPKRLIKQKKYLSIIISTILFIITLLVNEQYAQFIQLGIIIEAITLLPFFFTKEE
ncbi:accessory gene regulator ArgB-like protein [Staphylococcus argenteus]|nr:accessory gene regulator protein B [Staphylococcus argenteus]CDR64918.1 accessory gene regulator protein B [Staphylococcus argenteus]SGX18238.1 accessory gene regulator protein B [Staphylococcus argenteus]SGX24986.1 accessory gene regulator protein B [Staphylococcus argenteus]SGX43032.1 accessory gene regulator protein B [Staphylococcus argenteus]